MKPETAGWGTMDYVSKLRPAAVQNCELTELNKPSKPQQSDTQDNKSTDECQSGCDNRLGIKVTVFVLHTENDVASLEGHDSDGTNGNILGCGKERVCKDTDERRV